VESNHTMERKHVTLNTGTLQFVVLNRNRLDAIPDWACPIGSDQIGFQILIRPRDPT
jgi:hypothetical protein